MNNCGACGGTGHKRDDQTDKCHRCCECCNHDIEERQCVQFCPCGHIAFLTIQEIEKLGGKKQLEMIETGKKLDAPIFHSNDCDECQEERRQQERMYAYYDMEPMKSLC